VYQACIELV